MYQQQHRQQHNKRTLQLQHQQQPNTPIQSIIRPQTRLQQQPLHHQQHNQTQQKQTTTSKESQILSCGTGDGQQLQHQLQLQHQQKPQQELASSPQQQPSPFDCRILSSMAYQHKHALHRLRRLKKRSPHRDLVISFVPRLRTSIINRLDFFNRYSKQEQEVLSCFDFLDELVLNYCDGGLESPRNSQKLYQSMIYEFI